MADFCDPGDAADDAVFDLPDGCAGVDGVAERDFQYPEAPSQEAQVYGQSKHFASLVAFKEKYGHCLVPKVFPADRKLSYWVFRQRGLYSKGNKKCSHGSLSKRRYKKLKDIGFVFRAKNSEEQIKVEAARRQPQLDAKWNRFYEEFCEYRKKTGSSLIPKVFEENQTSRKVYEDYQ